MAITRDDVRRTALLARLALTPEEEERFTADLNHILDAFTTLQALPAEGRGKKYATPARAGRRLP